MLSTTYMVRELKRGWFAHDEGTLAQSAERVLQGELPHRDFDDVYTGGLAFLDAAAFRCLGINLASLRYVALAFFVVWVPVILYIAARFLSIPTACAVTLLSVAWGYPNYAAAVPSWYNLFLATFGLGALLRYIDTPKPQWLMLAGFVGGCSVLVKISGLFFIAGALLFLLFREQEISAGHLSPSKRNVLYKLFVFSCALVYAGLVFALLRSKFNVVTFGYLFVPGVATAAVIIWREFQNSNLVFVRFRSLLREVSPFLLGALGPVLVFVTLYAKENALLALFRGTFILPQQRFSYHAAITQSDLKFLGGAIVDVILLWSIFLAPPLIARKARIAIPIGLALSVVLATRTSIAQRAVWSVFWNLVPVAILAGFMLLVSKRVPSLKDTNGRQRLFLLLAVTAGCSMIQFPFFVPIYFCYVAPLGVLSCAAVLASTQPPRRFLAYVYAIVMCYVLFEVTPGFLNAMGSHYAQDIQTHELNLQRAGGLRVSPRSAAVYEDLGKVIHDHARGTYIYATPDCPEVYFLYGFRNPTRTLFDFFDDPAGRFERILGLVRSTRVNLIVFNRAPYFSNPVSNELDLEFQREFPEHQMVGWFEVRWKP